MTFRKQILAALVCLATLSSLSGCGNAERREAQYIKRGNALYEKGNFKGARIEYKNAARLNPVDAEPYYKIGLLDEQEGALRNAFANFMAAEQQNKRFYPAVLKIAQYALAAEQYDETRKRIDAILSEEPDNADAHALSAALFLRETKLDEAEREARQALAKDPANVSACSALAGIYAAQNDIDKAVAAVNDGIGRNPKNLRLPMLRVTLFEKTNDLPKIAESYRALFKLKPDETQFRANLAEAYVKAGKLDEAEASLREGAAVLPDTWDMKRRLAQFLTQYRGIDAAEAEIQKLMRDDPSKDEPYFWLAELYENSGATDKAEALLNQLVERGKFDEPALNARALLARIGMKRGNRDLAKKLVAVVLGKQPDNRSALLVCATMEMENGSYQSAVSDLRTIVGNAPKDAEALQLLGETLFLQGRIDLAIDTMKKLVDVDPANFAARVRLAQIVGATGDAKQAMELISLVTKAAPDYPIGWEAAARIAIEDGKWLPAEAAIRALDKIDGQHATASFLEGQVLDKTGRGEEALAKYREVIDADPSSPLAGHAVSALVELDRKLGRMDAAARYLETLKTDAPMISTWLGKCYASLGKAKEAAAAYDKAIEANPAFADPYLDRAGLYAKEHNREQAIEILKKGASAAPGDFRAPLVAANLLGETGKVREALALYDDMLARNPDLDIAANNLAAMISDYLPDDSAALEKARQAAERFSGSTNPFLLDTLGWVYFRQGNFALAQTFLERALKRRNDLSPQIHYHYGAILLKGGRIEKAKTELGLAVADGSRYPGSEEAKKLLESK